MLVVLGGWREAGLAVGRLRDRGRGMVPGIQGCPRRWREVGSPKCVAHDFKVQGGGTEGKGRI